MKHNYKPLLSLFALLSLLIVSCDNKPQESVQNSESNSISQILSSQSPSSVEETSNNSSFDSSESSESGSTSSETSNVNHGCENDLHSFVSYQKVDGGHRKTCIDCGAYVGELESHLFFDSSHLYCDACGTYDESLTQANLSKDFLVKVNSSNGVVQRTIIQIMYQTINGGLFTTSSPNNAHSSYSDFNVESAKFYYDNNIDDGTKLFMLEETASRKSISTCKTIYTYVLRVYGGIVPSTFSYTNGHITISDKSISEWLSSNTPINQINYDYLYVSHHAEAHTHPVSGSSAVVNEVVCRDCGQFLYQEIE